MADLFEILTYVKTIPDLIIRPLTSTINVAIRPIVGEVDESVKKSLNDIFSLPTTGPLVPLLNNNAIDEFASLATNIASIDNLQTLMIAQANRPTLKQVQLDEIVTSAEGLLTELESLIEKQGVQGLDELLQFAVDHLQELRQDIDNMASSIEHIHLPTGLLNFDSINKMIQSVTADIKKIDVDVSKTTLLSILIVVKTILGVYGDILSIGGAAVPVGLSVGFGVGAAAGLFADVKGSLSVINLGVVVYGGIATVLHIVVRILECIIELDTLAA